MWNPASEDQVHSAISNRTLTEDHSFEVKSELGRGSGANKELARDMAGFAIDGGTILVGVSEDKEDRTWSPSPIELNGCGERINQIAAMNIDPPLAVTVRDLPSAEDSAKGYLLIQIPPSAVGPHMVDGVYYGRSDRTRRRLGDAEVRRFHAAQQQQRDIAVRLLEQEILRDPVPVQSRAGSHLYLVAEPLVAPPEIAVELVRERQSDLRHILEDAERWLPPRLQQYAPNPWSGNHVALRANGTAFTSFDGGRTPSENHYDLTVTDIEFLEPGGIRVLSGRLREGDYLLEGIAVGYAMRLVRWVAAVAQATGYRGPWALGLAGTELRGARSWQSREDFASGYGYPALDIDRYEATTIAHLSELTDTPWVPVKALTARLCRGLGTVASFSDAFDPPTS